MWLVVVVLGVGLDLCVLFARVLRVGLQTAEQTVVGALALASLPFVRPNSPQLTRPAAAGAAAAPSPQAPAVRNSALCELPSLPMMP